MVRVLIHLQYISQKIINRRGNCSCGKGVSAVMNRSQENCDEHTIQLKSCPFCGGKAVIVKESHREYAPTFFVMCKNRCIRQFSQQCFKNAESLWNDRGGIKIK